MIINKKCKK